MLFNILLSQKIPDTYSVWLVITFICIIVLSQTILFVALVYAISKNNKRTIENELQKPTNSSKPTDTFTKKKSLFHSVPTAIINCLKDFYYEEESINKTPEKVLELPANHTDSDNFEIVQEIRQYGYLNHALKMTNLMQECEQNIGSNPKNKTKMKHMMHPVSNKGKVIQNSI